MNFEDASIEVEMLDNETQWFHLNDYDDYEHLLSEYQNNPLKLHDYPFVVDYSDIHPYYIEKNKLNPEFFEVLAVYADLEEYEKKPYIIFLNNDPSAYERNSFMDSYQGHWNSFLEFATNYMQDCYGIPKALERYIDYEAFADDLSYEFWEEDGYVFSNY